MKQGETQARIYYRIENFDEVGEPRRSRAVQAEKDRVEKFGPRFRYAEDWYHKVGPGTKLTVLYCCFSDGQIEVWSVHPRSLKLIQNDQNLLERSAVTYTLEIYDRPDA